MTAETRLHVLFVCLYLHRPAVKGGYFHLKEYDEHEGTAMMETPFGRIELTPPGIVTYYTDKNPE